MKKRSRHASVLSRLSTIIAGCLLIMGATSSAYCAGQEKIGIFVTPELNNDPVFPIGYHGALDSLKGHAATVWVLQDWASIERTAGVYSWSELDFKVNGAYNRGFKVGLRIQIVLNGHDQNRNFVSISKIPSFINQDMRSAEFKQKVTKFYNELAKRYKGKAQYIAIGNTTSKYFERNPTQWEGFKAVYDSLVDAMHAGDSSVKVLCDIAVGDTFWVNKDLLKKYMDFFKASKNDGIGIVFYFGGVFINKDPANFNDTVYNNVLDTICSMANPKKIHILEGSYFSINPTTGSDLSANQKKCVNMMLKAVTTRDELLGCAWWQMFDAQDLPNVAWDVKAGFGLFDATGAPKPSWQAWKKWSDTPSKINSLQKDGSVQLANVNVYPNPLNLSLGGSLIFSNVPKGALIRISDILGRELAAFFCPDGAGKWNADPISPPPGTYMYSVHTPAGINATGRILIQK